MTAITFNGANAIKRGTVDLSRVYCGPTLVWAKATGLPYSNALTALPAGWTIVRGAWAPKLFMGVTGISGSGTIGAQINSVGISAYNVRVSANFNQGSGGYSVGLQARDTGHGWYGCEYTLGKLTILRTGSPLGSWAIPGAPDSGKIELICVGDTITAKIGTVAHSVTNAGAQEPGAVCLTAALGGWLGSLSVTSA